MMSHGVEIPRARKRMNITHARSRTEICLLQLLFCILRIVLRLCDIVISRRRIDLSIAIRFEAQTLS